MTPTTSTPTNAATNPTNLTTSPTSTAGTPKATVTPGSLSSSSQDKDAILSTKCSRRGCKDNSSLPTIKCGYEKCTRRIHMACFQQLYGSKGYNKLGAGDNACIKKCYDCQVIFITINQKSMLANRWCTRMTRPTKFGAIVISVAHD